VLLTSHLDIVYALTGPPQVRIEVKPNSVEISPKGQMEVLVVARNPIAEELHDVRLSWFSDAGVTVSPESPKSNVLVPYGTLAWLLRLSQADSIPTPGTVYLRIGYTWQRKNGVGEVPCLSLASLNVKARKLNASEQVAEIQLKTALTELMEHRPGIVYLLITNISDVSIKVTKIEANMPIFLKCTLPELKGEVSIAPREIRAFQIKIEATEAVQPGVHMLLFEAKFEWKKSGREWTGNAIASHEVQVGVLGESELLTAVGVPSFLLLPGFLMVLTFALLWRVVEPRTDFPLKAKAGEFWLVAITLSLLTALMYPVVTGWQGVARNYLKGYGLSDVMSVWFSSIIFSAGAYFVLVTGIGRGVKLYRRWDEERRTPSATDTPINVLRKLHRQNLGLILDRVNVKIEGEFHRAYLLQPREQNQQRIWVGPNIIVHWQAGDFAELKQKVDYQLGLQRSANDLANLLEEGQRRDILEARWKPMKQLTRPYEVNASELSPVQPPTNIVEQE